jgi:hypothetical protein
MTMSACVKKSLSSVWKILKKITTGCTTYHPNDVLDQSFEKKNNVSDPFPAKDNVFVASSEVPSLHEGDNEPTVITNNDMYDIYQS